MNFTNEGKLDTSVQTYESTYIKFKNKENEAMSLQVRRTVAVGREAPGGRHRGLWDAGHIPISALVLAHRPVLFEDVRCIVRTICALFGVHNVFGIKNVKCTECGIQKRH